MTIDDDACVRVERALERARARRNEIDVDSARAQRDGAKATALAAAASGARSERGRARTRASDVDRDDDGRQSGKCDARGERRACGRGSGGDDDFDDDVDDEDADDAGNERPPRFDSTQTTENDEETGKTETSHASANKIADESRANDGGGGATEDAERRRAKMLRARQVLNERAIWEKQAKAIEGKDLESSAREEANARGMTTRDALRRAKALLSARDAFARGVERRTGDDRGVNADDRVEAAAEVEAMAEEEEEEEEEEAEEAMPAAEAAAAAAPAAPAGKGSMSFAARVAAMKLTRD